MPKVSIIVPVYNVEQYLNRCLTSLVNQSLEDIEIIIVNDGSTDNSEQVINQYIKNNSNIIYLKKENGGLSSARNYGLKYAKGEYIAFLDSDDYIERNTYKLMYEKAKLENSDYVECDFYWQYPDYNKHDIGYRYKDKKEMFAMARVVAWNKLIKKSIITINKLEFPEGMYYEDVEFFYKLLPYINKFSFVEEPLIYYTQRENSIVNNQDKRTSHIFIVLDNVIKYYKDRGLYETYKTEIEYTYTRLLLCSSLKRILQIKDKQIRKDLLSETWKRLNSRFPNWKKNEILKKNKTVNGKFMKTINKVTYKIYTKILGVIWK